MTKEKAEQLVALLNFFGLEPYTDRPFSELCLHKPGGSWRVSYVKTDTGYRWRAEAGTCV